MTLETRTEDVVSRLRVVVRGAVQGVGFRPFVHRLANQLGLPGWVNNSAQGVFIEVEGGRAQLEHFLLRLETQKPPRSFVQSCEATWLDVVGYDGFEIRESEMSGDKTTLVLPDIATCPDCLREILDPTNRRYLYPFTNCTNCGPRFSVIEALPYDRANTSMRGFTMCPACQAEYDDPPNRRFHAQPNACPVCGPQLQLWPGDASANHSAERTPRPLAHGNDALLAAAHVIRCGQIVAVKGIGGFHLMVDARHEEAVRRLRERKHREEKPFALLFPTMASVRQSCEISAVEEQLLRSPEAPLVLLRRRCSGAPTELESVGTFHPLARSVAPGNPNLGVMLPSNPLHHLLMAELGFPVVATSGNLSDEPICTDEFEALERLCGIADVLLVHNRPIVRPVDDSIVRVVLGREMVLRRARGYAPLPILVRTRSTVSHTLEENWDTVQRVPTVLAVGAHLKNAIALAVGESAFVSQHIGDLETEPAHEAFRRAAADLPRLYEVQSDVIVADLHPDYLSTQFAMKRRLPARLESEKPNQKRAGSETGAPQIIQVQHHIAHVLSCIAENEVKLPALGVAWDGTGLGTDGTIWGGEFFRVTEQSVERVAHLRPFRLPGGDAAVKEPRRAALGLMHELAGVDDNLLLHMQQETAARFSKVELAALNTALARGVNAPFTTSMGRLFDAVAALTGLRQQMRFEGQAAMELEFALAEIESDEHYDLPIIPGQAPRVLDWAPTIRALFSDVRDGVAVGEISARFHNALAESIVAVAREVGVERVALSGGCFQNRYLTERAVRRLRAEGFHAYWHQRVPPNDGGIALGQIVAVRRELTRRSAAVSSGPAAAGRSGDDHRRIGSAAADGVAHRRVPLVASCSETISRVTHHASH